MGADPGVAGGDLTEHWSGAERRRELPLRVAVVVLFALVVQFLALALVQARDDAITVDEGVYLAAGVTALTEHDLRLNPEQPPLFKAIAALPVLAARPAVPKTEAWDENRWFDYTEEFVEAQDDAGKLRDVVFLGRIVPVLLTALTGILAYAVAGRLLGRLPGLVAAGAWLTTPYVVGLGHLNAIDVGFAAATMLAALALVRYIDEPGDRRAVLLGGAAGIVLLSRHAGLVLVLGMVVAVVVVGRAVPRAAARHALAVAVVAVAVVWGGMRAIAPGAPGGAAGRQLQGAVDAAEAESGLAGLLALAPLPLEYRAGLAYLTLTEEARPAYLLGERWTGGRWWYWPASMAVKLPPSVLQLAAIGVVGLVIVRRRSRDRVLLAVAVPAAVLVAGVMAQSRTIGLRYLFPVLALGAVASAGAVVLLRRRWGAWLLALLAALQLAFLWTSHPHSLAWTSPFFRPGYRHTSESDLDWGQDRRRLEEWAAGRDVWVALTLSRGVGVDVPGARRLLDADVEDVTGWVAVGATTLTVTSARELAWLRKYCPVGTIGGSILLYRFGDPPSPEPGPDTPAAPCTAGARVSTASGRGRAQPAPREITPPVIAPVGVTPHR